MSFEFDTIDKPLRDDEYPDEPDEDFCDSISCDACGAEVYDDAEQCPYCGQFLLTSRSIWTGKPLWWVVLGAAGIASVIALLALA